MIDELGMKQSFVAGLEMSGSQQALNQIAESLIMGDQIALLGILPGASPVEVPRIAFKTIAIEGVYDRELSETRYKMIAMLHPPNGCGRFRQWP